MIANCNMALLYDPKHCNMQYDNTKIYKINENIAVKLKAHFITTLRQT